MTAKVDLKKTYKPLFSAGPEPALVDVPSLPYLMVDGCGVPANAAFHQAIQALYSVAYTIKFARKRAGQGPDYGVTPLESLWWSSDSLEICMESRPDAVRWTVMILQPDCVTRDDIASAAAVSTEKREKKKTPQNPFLAELRLETRRGCRAAQLLHVGPYSDQGPSVQRLKDFIDDSELRICGRHHEIYLNDPNRVAPAKLKTILRFAVH